MKINGKVPSDAGTALTSPAPSVSSLVGSLRPAVRSKKKRLHALLDVFCASVVRPNTHSSARGDDALLVQSCSQDDEERTCAWDENRPSETKGAVVWLDWRDLVVGGWVLRGKCYLFFLDTHFAARSGEEGMGTTVRDVVRKWWCGIRGVVDSPRMRGTKFFFKKTCVFVVIPHFFRVSCFCGLFWVFFERCFFFVILFVFVFFEIVF